MAGRIRIRLKAFDHAVIDQASADIVRTAEKTGAAGVRSDSAARQDAAVDGAAVAARRQEDARAVRAEDAQARDRHSRFAPADDGRADEAGSAGRRGRRDQGRVAMAERTHRPEARHDPGLRRGRHRGAGDGHRGRPLPGRPGARTAACSSASGPGAKSRELEGDAVGHAKAAGLDCGPAVIARVRPHRRRRPPPGADGHGGASSPPASWSRSPARPRAAASRAWCTATASAADRPRTATRGTGSRARSGRAPTRRASSRASGCRAITAPSGTPRLGLRVVRVDAERNLLFVRGAVPGSKNGIVTVAKQGGPSRHD